MNFSEAMEELVKGNRVQRTTWYHKVYLEKDCSWDYVYKYNENVPIGNCLFSYEDYKATDWELYDDDTWEKWEADLWKELRSKTKLKSYAMFGEIQLIMDNSDVGTDAFKERAEKLIKRFGEKK